MVSRKGKEVSISFPTAHEQCFIYATMANALLKQNKHGDQLIELVSIHKNTGKANACEYVLRYGDAQFIMTDVHSSTAGEILVRSFENVILRDVCMHLGINAKNFYDIAKLQLMDYRADHEGQTLVLDPIGKIPTNGSNRFRVYKYRTEYLGDKKLFDEPLPPTDPVSQEVESNTNRLLLNIADGVGQKFGYDIHQVSAPVSDMEDPTA